jgi:hypothetical protein
MDAELRKAQHYAERVMVEYLENAVISQQTRALILVLLQRAFIDGKAEGIRAARDVYSPQAPEGSLAAVAPGFATP